jgi:hypothetical protein
MSRIVKVSIFINEKAKRALSHNFHLFCRHTSLLSTQLRTVFHIITISGGLTVGFVERVSVLSCI